jgi:hypothetical protein
VIKTIKPLKSGKSLALDSIYGDEVNIYWRSHSKSSHTLLKARIDMDTNQKDGNNQVALAQTSIVPLLLLGDGGLKICE